MDFDLILDYLGHCGRFQLIVMLLCGLSQFFGGVQFSSNVLFHPNATRFACACNEMTHDFESQVPVSPTSLILSYDKYVASSTEISGQLMDEEGPSKTISNSVFGLGAMLGAVVAGICADKFGRKQVMKISSALMLVSCLSSTTSLVLNFWIFYCLRFITAIAVSGLFQTGYIIVVEMIGTSKRPLCMGLMQIIFIGGKLFSSLVAYNVESWRSLELFISLPAISLIVYFWWLPESVRWLIFKGKYSKAKAIVLEAAKWNNATIPDVLLLESDYEEIDKESVDNFVDGLQEYFSSFAILQTPKIRTWSLVMCFIWVVNSMVYYDIASNSGNISPNIFANFAVLSTLEILFVLFAVIALYYCERRHTTCFVMVLGAFLCVVTAFIPQGHPLVCGWISILGRSFISVSYTIIYLYSIEIFPTNLRGTTTGLNAMFFHFGGVLAPFIFELRKFYCPLPSVTFAVVSVMSSILALKLPERMDWQLPETVGESLVFGVLRSSGLARLYRPRSSMRVTR